MNRSPIRRQSKKQAKKIRDARPVRTAVKDRDGGCVLRAHTDVWGRCFGDLEVHHLHKASAVGSYSLTNCVTLCSFHNGEVENHPTRAKAWGLVVNSAIPATEARTRRVAHGLPAALPDDIDDANEGLCEAAGCPTRPITTFSDGAGRSLQLCEDHGDMLAVGFPLRDGAR